MSVGNIRQKNDVIIFSKIVYVKPVLLVGNVRRKVTLLSSTIIIQHVSYND